MSKKLNYEDVKRNIETNSTSKLLSDTYQSRKHKLKLQCKCGNVFEVTYESFLGGKHVCKTCSNLAKAMKLRKYDTKTIKDKLQEEVGNEYSLLSGYNGYMNKITLRHNTCGNVYEVTPDKFFGHLKRRCPKCRGGVRKTYNDLLKVVNDRKDYTLLSKEYVNCNTKVRMLHNVCGTEFEVKPCDFKNGLNGCPYCKQSKGEKLIENYLIDNNISYQRQYRFKECRIKRPLPFDFAILENDVPIMLIEFNGVQHYEPFRFEHKDIEQKRLKARQERDKIKIQFAKDKHIPLLIIRYDQLDNIVNILDSKIRQGNTEVTD